MVLSIADFLARGLFKVLKTSRMLKNNFIFYRESISSVLKSEWLFALNHRVFLASDLGKDAVASLRDEVGGRRRTREKSDKSGHGGTPWQRDLVLGVKQRLSFNPSCFAEWIIYNLWEKRYIRKKLQTLEKSRTPHRKQLVQMCSKRSKSPNLKSWQSGSSQQ
jgi:hypothetical protein